MVRHGSVSHPTRPGISAGNNSTGIGICSRCSIDTRATRASKSPHARMLYCLSPSRHVVPVVAVIQSSVGEWLRLVEHLVRDQGVGGSNPLSPTNFFRIK